MDYYCHIHPDEHDELIERIEQRSRLQPKSAAHEYLTAHILMLTTYMIVNALCEQQASEEITDETSPIVNDALRMSALVEAVSEVWEHHTMFTSTWMEGNGLPPIQELRNLGEMSALKEAATYISDPRLRIEVLNRDNSPTMDAKLFTTTKEPLIAAQNFCKEAKCAGRLNNDDGAILKIAGALIETLDTYVSKRLQQLANQAQPVK